MSFLSDILARKRIEVAERRRASPEGALEARAEAAPPARSLLGALSPRGGPTRIIAEVKRASPSAGAIRADLDPVKLAGEYESAGAAAISVLTDGPGFGGSLDDLAAVRARVQVPVLRKDFVLDRYQLLEARAFGADAVLLIVAALEPPLLGALRKQAVELGLDVLVEVHDERELDTALEAGATLVGVNNRDLKTFQVDLATSERLIARMGAGVTAVAESGIAQPDHVRRLRRAGAANFLIGEALVRAPSAKDLLRSLLEA